MRNQNLILHKIQKNINIVKKKKKKKKKKRKCTCHIIIVSNKNNLHLGYVSDVGILSYLLQYQQTFFYEIYM